MSGSAVTGRGAMVLKAGGIELATWTRCEATRDLGDISGSFVLDYDDTVRYAKALPTPNVAGLIELAKQVAIKPGVAARIEIDGECVMQGWVQDVNLDGGPDSLRASVIGFDKTIDLVECSANPEGPVEYKGLDLLGIVTRLSAPFGITVKADVDIGDPFPKFALDVSETVMAAIEKATRQRGILPVSDGVGGLLLTHSGSQRGPVPLVWAQNIHRYRVQSSMRQRYSDYWVKGQLPRAHATKKRPVPLDSSTAPLGEGAPLQPPVPMLGPVTATGHKRGKGKHGPVYQAGHATDPEVTRYRPRVFMTRAQAGLDTVDEQAAWRARTAAAQAHHMWYTFVGWRAGPNAVLWRPNEIVAVTDPMRGLDGVDQLIAGVNYLDGEDGQRTVLRVVDPAAYSLDEELVSTRRAGRSQARHHTAVDATSSRFR